MTNSLSTTLMELLKHLFGSEAERAAFLDNPNDYLDDKGFGDLSCADFDDALLAFVDNDNNLGGNFSNHVGTQKHDGQSDSNAIAEKLTKIIHEGDTYITNNDNDVVNDASFKGTIIAGDDVNFDNDITSASGDGAVAAGDDINGDVVTGDRSFIGDDNEVVGDDSDNAFNEGAIVDGNLTASGQSAVNLGEDGSADGGDVTVRDSFQDNSQDNDVDVDVEVEDVGNTTTTNEDNDEVEESGPGGVIVV